jgi:flagellar basal body-associated protein FliL
MHDDDGTAGAGREEASGSIRVAIVIFMVTLVILMGMGIMWMFIRV